MQIFLVSCGYMSGMCGRYLLTMTREVLERFLAISDADQTAPNVDIRPTDSIVVIEQKEDQRKFEVARWGLIPEWAKDCKIGLKMINARAEGIADKPAFRNVFRKHRVLIPANGFYEWKTVEGHKKKQPYKFSLRDDSLFAFAGLISYWHDDDAEKWMRSASIITCDANALVAEIHDRMPVMLPRQLEARWLDPGTPVELAADLLQPYPASLMRIEPWTFAAAGPITDSA
jgi:putative SOS response-associated peptidase YedK